MNTILYNRDEHDDIDYNYVTINIYININSITVQLFGRCTRLHMSKHTLIKNNILTAPPHNIRRAVFFYITLQIIIF